MTQDQIEEQQIKTWTDISGEKVPLKYVPKLAKLKERHSLRLLKAALDIQKRLIEFKKLFNMLNNEVYEKELKEKGLFAKDQKGNFRWHNFSGTVRLEMDMAAKYSFDKEALKECQDLVNEHIDTLEGNEDLKPLAKDALKISKGNMDLAKLNKLYENRKHFKNDEVVKAIEKLKDSVKSTKSKAYTRLFIRENPDDDWTPVILNLSAVDIGNEKPLEGGSPDESKSASK